MAGELAARVGLGRTVDLPFGEALQRTERALEREGFGVLTRIDIAATLRKKLDVDLDPFVILGACMPAMAHRALQAEPEVGLLLPCNVVVRVVAGGRTRVEAMDPDLMTRMFPGADLEQIAATVKTHLQLALEAV